MNNLCHKWPLDTDLEYLILKSLPILKMIAPSKSAVRTSTMQALRSKKEQP